MAETLFSTFVLTLSTLSVIFFFFFLLNLKIWDVEDSFSPVHSALITLKYIYVMILNVHPVSGYSNYVLQLRGFSYID